MTGGNEVCCNEEQPEGLEEDGTCSVANMVNKIEPDDQKAHNSPKGVLVGLTIELKRRRTRIRRRGFVSNIMDGIGLRFDNAWCGAKQFRSTRAAP